MQPVATIHMDVLDFCVLNSERSTAQQVLEQHQATVEGDADFARFVLENSHAIY